jgi:DNA-binding PadR family transcriptional regulator
MEPSGDAEDRWIARHQQEDTSRDRQAYQITPAGRKQLLLELDRMKQLTKAAAARMRLKEV